MYLRTLKDFFALFKESLFFKVFLFPLIFWLMLAYLLWQPVTGLFAGFLGFFSDQWAQWLSGVLGSIAIGFLFLIAYWISLVLMIELYAEKIFAWVNERYYQVPIHDIDEWHMIKRSLRHYARYGLLLALTWPLLFVPLINVAIPVLWSVESVRKPLLETCLAQVYPLDQLDEKVLEYKGISYLAITPWALLSWVSLVNLFLPILQMLSISHGVLKKIQQEGGYGVHSH